MFNKNNIKKLRSIIKLFFELLYWKLIKGKEGKLNNQHYKYFYTTYFSLPSEFYNDKIILDIGCGPRGSLEWADMAKRRIGIDPLADKYMRMGASKFKMEYKQGNSECLPFEDNYFDVISSFNSIDHVNNLQHACDEIRRTLKNDGIFLLIVDVHIMPTITEPQTITWDFINKYFPDFQILEENHLESIKNFSIYKNIRGNIKVRNKSKQKGVLTAKLKKVGH